MTLAPFAALACIYGVFIYFSDYQRASSGDVFGSFYGITPQAWDNFWQYLRWLALPLPPSLATWITDAQIALAVLLLSGLSLSLLFRKWLLVWLLAWVFVALLPFAFIKRPIELRYTYLASAPYAALLALSLNILRSWMLGPYIKPASSLALTVGVIILAIFLGHRAREQQWWIAMQSRNFESLVQASRSLCGHLEPQSHMYVLNSPAFDPVGFNTFSAVNVWQREIFVDKLESPPTAIDEPACVIAHQNGVWLRVR